jgi:hypothetical protein
MNSLIIIMLAWVFAFAEDIWFNRLLKYQLSGEAQRLKKSALKAHSLFDQRRNSNAWIILGAGLTAVVLSFPNPFTLTLSGLALTIGIVACLWYVIQKVRVYRAASTALGA